MAREVRSFSPSVPAGTTIASGWTADLSFPARTVVEIDVRVPPGPRGQMGFAIGSAGVPVIPFQSGQWIVTDDESIDWPLTDYIDSGSWTLFAYNLGQFAHTVYVRFQLDTIAQPSSAVANPIPAAAISNPPPNAPGGTIIVPPAPTVSLPPPPAIVGAPTF